LVVLSRFVSTSIINQPDIRKLIREMLPTLLEEVKEGPVRDILEVITQRNGLHLLGGERDE